MPAERPVPLADEGLPGVDASIPALLRDLEGIREVEVVYPAAEESAEAIVRTTLTEMSAEQESLYLLLQLAQYTA